ncbi:MAG: ATP synthase F1 subunit delta [Eubacteriales bacterium]
MAYIDNGEKSFGDALFALCEEAGTTESVKVDFDILCSALCGEPEYVKLLDNPALSREERVALADKAFGSLDRYLVNMVKILAQRREVYLIFKIRDSFFESFDEARGIERVEAVSAVPLTDEQTERLAQKLEKITGKNIIITNKVDSSILGGVKLRFMGRQIDGSIKTKLDRFEKSLKDIVI